MKEIYGTIIGGTIGFMLPTIGLLLALFTPFSHTVFYCYMGCLGFAFFLVAMGMLFFYNR